MPTKEDLDNLLANCTKEQITTGIPGYKFTGNDAYSSNSIFLPTPGYGWAGDFIMPGRFGSIWSSTAAPPDDDGNIQGYRLALDQEGTTCGVVWTDGRPCGHTVRAILQ